MKSVPCYYEQCGWQQSHSEAANGFIFEKLDDTDLVIMACDLNGVILTQSRFDRFAVVAGLAESAVALLYRKLNQPIDRSDTFHPIFDQHHPGLVHGYTKCR